MSTATSNATPADPSTIREHKLQQVERANATGLRNSGVTEIAEIPNCGHALTKDNGWQEVANTALIHPELHVSQHVISKLVTAVRRHESRQQTSTPQEKPSMTDFTRRDLLIGGSAILAATALPRAVRAAQATAESSRFAGNSITQGEQSMATITTKDGTSIYYKDWGKGQPIVFSHGWPLSADDWDGQMLFFGQRGYRVIAHDRRGHGRSTQTWDGNEMNTYADDLAALTEKLDLKNAIHVGHSTGGGEVARYIGRHGTKRVAMAVLISAVPPLMVKTDKNPGGLPVSVFDDLQAQLANNRAQLYKDITLPFYGYNRPGAKISEGIREHWWLQGMMGGVKPHYDCIKAFSQTDFTEDLKKFDVPTLILHGDDDQIVPIGAAGLMSAKIVKNATLKVYPGFPHGMPTTNADQINADLLAFVGQRKQAAA